MQVEQLRISIPLLQPVDMGAQSSNCPLEGGKSKAILLEIVSEPHFSFRDVTTIIGNFQPM
jgi:hypothetical protein